MALYPKKEFGQLAGLKNPRDIKVYINRNQVIPSGDYIDDTIPQNLEWINKRRAKKGWPNLGEGVPVELEPTYDTKAPNVSKAVIGPGKAPNVKNPTPRKEPTLEDLENKDPNKMTKSEIELVTKRAEMEKKLEEVELAKIKVAKQKGELIPAELIYSLITEMSEAMKISYNDAIENYTVVVARQKKLSGQEEANIKSHFTRIINDTLKRQTVVAKKGLQNIVKEYQEVRDRGERK